MVQMISPQRSDPVSFGRLAPRSTGVVELIKEFIVRNNLQPGDLMPTETVLCDELGVSRSSVREAIKTLSALDIVEVRHGHGTYVGSLSLRALVQSLAFRGLLSSNDDQKVLLDLVEVRQMLEQGLATQIVLAMKGELHSQLREVTDAMEEKAARGEEFFDEDREFHLMLMHPLGNDLVIQLTGAFWDVHAMVAPILGPAGKDIKSTAQDHVDIVDAAAAGDEEGLREAIAAHYEPIRRRIEAIGRSD